MTDKITVTLVIDQLRDRLKELEAEREDTMAALEALEKVANPMRVSGADDDDDTPFEPQNWVEKLDDCKLSLGQVFARYGWTDKMAERAARHWTKVDFRPGAVNYVWVNGNVSRPGFDGPVAKR